MARYDAFGHLLMRKARLLPPNVHASREARELSEFTGLIAKDIDALRGYSASRNLVLITRLPDFNAPSYAIEIQNESAFPKPSDLKQKTGAYGAFKFNGTLYVSDMDMMCMHKLDKRADRFTPIESDWDGKRAMTPIEHDYIGSMNSLLISKTQHAFNDNWVTESGAPKNIDIGNEFLIAACGTLKVIESVKDLKREYERIGLENWHWQYETMAYKAYIPPDEEDDDEA